jgi:phosphohistidine phosphatase SixA
MHCGFPLDKLEMRLLCLLFVLLVAADAARAQDGGFVVVRHAEKVADGTADPALTPEGQARASALAESLSGTRIAALLATQYRRTVLTLQPLAARHGLEIEIVEAASGEIEAHVRAVAEAARARAGAGLVVIAGHSNTVPLIVEALSGRAAEPIPEDEYDRFYLILPGAESTSLITTRYGRSD